MTKILLVEDDKSLREIYGVRLYSEGYDIVSAGDGEEALAVAIKDRPALIVSDVMMPKISGFDMLDILRSTTETKNIKVIMMTALSSEDQRKRGEELGADRYLVKSQVGIEDVVRTVHEVLGDSPTTASSAPANPFATPAPTAATTAAPQTQRPTTVQAPSRPTAETQYSQPSPQPTQAPVQQPSQSPVQAQPQQPQAGPLQSAQTQSQAQPQPSQSSPQLPVANMTPQSSSLPQPTAPFSTQRPANLADRIIQPINSVDDTEDHKLSSLMDQELGSNNQSSQSIPVTQSPSQSPQAEPQQSSSSQSPQTPPSQPQF